MVSKTVAPEDSATEQTKPAPVVDSHVPALPTDSTEEPQAVSIGGMEAGSIHTTSVRSSWWMQPSITCVARFRSVSNTEPPTVLHGLNAVNLSAVSIDSQVRSVADNSAQIELCTSGGAMHYSSGCSWLKIPKDEQDIQWGTVCISRTTSKSAMISFPRPYNAPPKVIVWLTAADIDPASVCRVATYVTDITSEEFTIHLDTWDDTKLTYASAMWLAHSGDRAGVHSGTFSTTDVRPANQPRSYDSGRVAFWKAKFSAQPQVFAAFNKLEISKQGNVRLLLGTENVSVTGMDWHFDSRGTFASTLLNQAGASYFVFGP